MAAWSTNLSGALAAAPVRALRRHAPEGELAVKLRVSHLVESADFEPNELSPAAILIVRRLADPLPHGLPAGEFALAASQPWERAARSALAEVARAASRPARGSVPSNANAVLFADQAELLACFSRDYLRGEAASLWWWRTMLRSFPGTGSRALLDIWRREIRYVPAVVAKLSELGDAGWVLRSFTQEQARAVLQEVARAFDLRYVLEVAQNPPDRCECDTGDTSFDLSPASSVKGGALRAQRRRLPVSPPWRSVSRLRTVSARFSHEHAALLGISLELCMSPGILRSRSFAADFERWWQANIAEPVAGSETGESRVSTSKGFDFRDNIRQFALPDEVNSPGNTGSLQTSSSEHHLPEPMPLGKEVPIRSTSTSATELSPIRDNDVSLPATEAGEDLSHNLSPDVPTLSGTFSQEQPFTLDYDHDTGFRAASPSPDLTDMPTQVLVPHSTLEQPKAIADMKAALQAGDWVATELGGVFFLVNLLTSLEMPQSLEQAAGCDFGLGCWEWLELIARCLLSAARPGLADDPVWSLLAILDGRAPEQRAGKDFRPAALYRLPEAWFGEEQSSATTAAVRACRNRFELWTSLGFPLVISWFDQPPAAHDIRSWAGQHCLESFRQIPTSWAGARALGMSLQEPLRRLLAFLMPYVRWRLAAGLGLKPHRKVDLPKLLLSRTAKVWVSSTHVDVVMPLKQATSAVRIAGLDTDPGWVSQFGRVIKFYFQ